MRAQDTGHGMPPGLSSGAHTTYALEITLSSYTKGEGVNLCPHSRKSNASVDIWWCCSARWAREGARAAPLWLPCSHLPTSQPQRPLVIKRKPHPSVCLECWMSAVRSLLFSAAESKHSIRIPSPTSTEPPTRVLPTARREAMTHPFSGP